MAADTYRKAELSDAPALSKLAHRALQLHALPGWTDRAIQRLRDENAESVLRDFLPEAAFVHACVDLDSVVGFIANKVPRLVSLLVVDPDRQRQGVGSGFYPLSGFIDYEGCRFTRLGYWRKNPLLPK